MCKKIAHPGGCWIFRIQVENLTRGDSGWVETPVGAMSTYSLEVIALYLVAKFINLPGKIQNLGAKFFWRTKSKISAYNKVELQFLIDSKNFMLQFWKLMKLLNFNEINSMNNANRDMGNFVHFWWSFRLNIHIFNR